MASSSVSTASLPAGSGASKPGKRKGAVNVTELLVERTVMSVADRYYWSWQVCGTSMRLPTAGGRTMVSQQRYSCGTMGVIRDHNTSAQLSSHVTSDQNL